MTDYPDRSRGAAVCLTTEGAAEPWPATPEPAFFSPLSTSSWPGPSSQEEDLRDAVLLVLANKQDLPNAMKPAEVTDALGLSQLRAKDRKWCVKGTIATSGHGLYEVRWSDGGSGCGGRVKQRAGMRPPLPRLLVWPTLGGGQNDSLRAWQ